MRKSKIILAGALAFDLGVMIVAGHAAETQKGPAPAPTGAKSATTDGYMKHESYLKHQSVTSHKTEIELFSFRIDSINTVDVCKHKAGKVTKVGGVPTCQFPKAK